MDGNTKHCHHTSELDLIKCVKLIPALYERREWCKSYVKSCRTHLMSWRRVESSFAQKLLSNKHPVWVSSKRVLILKMKAELPYMLHNGFLRFTSGMTPADLLVASMAAKPFFDPHTCRQTLVGLESRIKRVAASPACDKADTLPAANYHCQMKIIRSNRQTLSQTCN